MSSALIWLLDSATVAVLLAYELYFAWFERSRPQRSARSAHARMREDWFLALSTQKGSELLLVQTLRNSLMSATMTASTAALGLIGTVTISASALHDTFEHPSPTVSGIPPRLALELVLLGLLFGSLVSSVMAVRFYNHAGFIGGMPVGSPDRKRWSAVGTKYVRRAGILYSWGLRHLVIVAPVLAAILHPAAGPIAAVLVVALLMHFDQVRAHEEPAGEADRIVPPQD